MTFCFCGCLDFCNSNLMWTGPNPCMHRLQMSYGSTFRHHKETLRPSHAACGAEQRCSLWDKIHCLCRQWTWKHGPRYDGAVPNEACKLLSTWRELTQHQPIQAGWLLTASVHKSPMSVRDGQVNACSQPLPELLGRGGNIPARGDSWLSLYCISGTVSCGWQGGSWWAAWNETDVIRTMRKNERIN